MGARYGMGKQKPLPFLQKARRTAATPANLDSLCWCRSFPLIEVSFC